MTPTPPVDPVFNPVTMAVSDFTKMPAEIIIDLINFDNGTSLTPDLLSFGIPSVLAGDSQHNTTVVATAIPGGYYTGSVTLTYNRIDLGIVPGARSIKFEVGAATRISDLARAISEAYQINLTPDDYIDGPLPSLANFALGPERDFELVAGPNSLIFNNKVSLKVFRRDIPLASVITKTVLNGLFYWQPGTGPYSI